MTGRFLIATAGGGRMQSENAESMLREFGSCNFAEDHDDILDRLNSATGAAACGVGGAGEPILRLRDSAGK